MDYIQGLRKGINLGGWLSQCVHTKKHYDSFISEDDIRRISTWGLDHIRLPIDCEAIETDEGRFIGIWSELARRYGKENNALVFELLNEVVEEENSEPWNILARRAIEAIRKYAPETQIIIGGIEWNSVRAVTLLDEPYDENIIYTFHFYEPFAFTHQNASWVPETTDFFIEYPSTVEDYKKAAGIIGEKAAFIFKNDAKEIGASLLEQLIIEAVTVAEKRGVALYCGEYGVIDQASADSTLRWYQDMHQLFEKYHIGRAAWSYKEMDFGIEGQHYEAIFEGILSSL